MSVPIEFNPLRVSEGDEQFDCRSCEYHKNFINMTKTFANGCSADYCNYMVNNGAQRNEAVIVFMNTCPLEIS